MKNLRDFVAQAVAKKSAIGHFNVSNLEMLKAVIDAAEKAGVPVIIGTSEGERDFIGVHEIVALVKIIREKRELPVFLNADHTYSYERVKEAIDAGYDSVIFDGAELSLEENISITKKCAEYAKNSGRDILIEGELGFIGKSSKILDDIPSGVELSKENLTDPEDAEKFVRETGVDLLAPAVGNFHGMLRGGRDPKLSIETIKAVAESAGVPLVLHGASGNSDDDLKNAVASGVSIVHVSTELRLAFRQGLVSGLGEDADEMAPYKYLKKAVSEVEKVVLSKLSAMNSLKI